MTHAIKNLRTDFGVTDQVMSILPEQGCIELQRDKPGRVHKWHRHDNAEVLIVIDGELKFNLEDSEVVCSKGDALCLSANDLHMSTAGDDGAVYLIAFRHVDVC